MWDRGKKEIRRRGRRERIGFVCVVVGMGGTVGVSLSNEKYCVVRKSYTLYLFLKKKIHTHTKQIIIFFLTFENM